MDRATGIKISPNWLAPETLRNVIEEFVTRDGTDIAEAETKIRQVEDLLQRGQVEIWFDETTSTCNIVVSPSSLSDRSRRAP